MNRIPMVLLGEVPDIVDAPGAEPLPDGGGEISVRDVSFWYGALSVRF